MKSATTVDKVQVERDDAYQTLEMMIGINVASVQRDRLFTTNSSAVFDAFLDGLPPHRRQHYNCNCCRKFVERFGSLVTISPEGDTKSIMWYGSIPSMFEAAVTGVRDKVLSAKVDGVFLSSEHVWGTPNNQPGPGSRYEGMTWTHMHSGNPSVFKPKTKTDSQVMAELHEDHSLIRRTLAEARLEVVTTVLRVLEAEAVTRSEKALAMARWFRDLLITYREVKGPRRDNLIWKAVAEAPEGFCHARNTVLGTLFDDVGSGLSFDEVKANWNKKMSPEVYQRPKTVSEGNLEVAEKLIAKLGAADSLKRRYARLDEIKPQWRPSESKAKEESGKVFGHINATGASTGRSPALKQVILPSRRITWEKFQQEVLPTARKIDLRTPLGRGGFFAMVTAEVPEAPPIIQWDGIDGMERNPFSWYVHLRGSFAHEWSIVGGMHTEVRAISDLPCHWQVSSKFNHQPHAAVFYLAGCRDKSPSPGGGLFPENLRSEYREARAAIEAYTKSAKVGGIDQSDACGLMFIKGDHGGLGVGWDCQVRVKSDDGVADYHIDRWE